MPDDGFKSYPRPSKILSKAALLAAWYGSRDSTNRPGSAGFDKQSARSFSARLDQQLENIVRQLRAGEFRFGPLRSKLLPKADGVRCRLICIPNVRDRLVQRAMTQYLTTSQRLGRAGPEVYGFEPGRSLSQAISTVLNYRTQYPFVFETDIESFFDKIDRGQLKAKVRKLLGRNSLVPLIVSAIDSEVRADQAIDAQRIEQMGVTKGRGLRQGMPLSPSLANLVLAPFDMALSKQKIRFVRYADDVVTFAKTRQEAMAHSEIIKEELARLGLTIPHISDEGKTRIVPRHGSFIFVGREFFFSERDGDYSQRIPRKKIEAIVRQIIDMADIDEALRQGWSISDIAKKLAYTSESYKHTYSSASNSHKLDIEISKATAEAMRSIYVEMFGSRAVAGLSHSHKLFLRLDEIPDVTELDDFGY